MILLVGPSSSRLAGQSALHALAAIAGCALLLGCGAGSHPAGARELEGGAPGDPEAQPSLAALPEMPQGATCNTVRTHQGLLVARETFDAALPPPPADRSYTSLQHWVDTAVVAWLERRRQQTDATRDRFLLEGAPNPSERAVSHAVIGLIHEDTALSLLRIPAPSELDSEPEIAQMYREIVQTQADTFTTSALIEFRDCANDAYRGPEDMRVWAEFCHARFDRLRERLPQRTKPGASAANGQ